MSMFGNLFGNGNSDGVGDISGRLIMVEAIAALTDYTHTPHKRAPSPYLPPDMMDDLVLSQTRGELSQQDVAGYSAHMGRLNNTPGGESKISMGYREYNKGLMKLKFKVQNGGMKDDYISVLGYITHNSAEGAISGDAKFVPSFSWRSDVMMENVAGHDGLSLNIERMGARVDYLINDGSHNQTEGIVSMRPSDIISSASDNIASKEVSARLQLEGLPGTSTVPINGGGSINHAGVVVSNRANFNPTKFSNSLLTGAISAARGIQTSHADDGVRSTSDYTSEMGQISNVARDMMTKEYRASEDEFLQAMKDISGSFKQLRGWYISEIADMFSNFEEIINNNGTVMLDRNQYEPIDYAEIAEVFGRSSPVETIAQEMIFNILDLLVSNGLSGLCIEGSNCDAHGGDHRLSNISLNPYNVKSLTDNDVHAFNKGVNLVDQLTNQIFNRLNGHGLEGITPIRIKLNASLFGSTRLTLTSMSSENYGTEVEYSFPTFAPSPYSPVFGDNDTLSQLSDSVYSNMKSYFFNY